MQHGDAAVMQPTTEPEEFLGVRDYRSGDRMRAIHWKLSSRFPEPVVREYGIPQKAPVAVGFLYALPDGMQDLAVLWTLCWRHCSLPSPIFARTATVLP
ncbi:MAG: DUF58 domain-containing protein [Ruminococcus sp.]